MPEERRVLLYFKNLSIAVDQLINAIFFGFADESLSARCWREKRWFRYVLDSLFFWQVDEQGRRHCEQSYIWERKRMDLPPEYRNRRTHKHQEK